MPPSSDQTHTTNGLTDRALCSPRHASGIQRQVAQKGQVTFTGAKTRARGTLSGKEGLVSVALQMKLFFPFNRRRFHLKIRPLGPSPIKPEVFLYFFGHNKAGGVRGDSSGVSHPACLAEQGYLSSL